jgi:hypothetical protein
VVVRVMFVLFFCSYVSREHRQMKVLQSPDMIVSCSPFSLCLPVPSSIESLRTLIVPIVQLLQTSKHLEKKNKQNF